MKFRSGGSIPILDLRSRPPSDLRSARLVRSDLGSDSPWRSTQRDGASAAPESEQSRAARA
eukprot:15471275-Alexandrium_andersonii.AAC.1